jgi:flagellar FliL protein
MSAAAEAVAAPKAGGKKKLLVILAAAVLLLGVAGTAAVVILKKRAAEAAAAEEGDDNAAALAANGAHAKAPAHDPHAKPPAFVPLDPFVVNLADRDADRYAQIGVVLQVPDEHASEDIKGYLPAIRNNILLLLAYETSEDLAGREGKERLAKAIRRESLKAMGYEVEDDAPAAAAASGAPAPKPKAKAKPKGEEEAMPITAVQFSSFIIQ